MNKAITNKKKKRKSESLLGMAFFGPALVLLSVFLFIPMLLTLIFSFTDFFALNPDLTHFVGLDNYFQIFQDEETGVCKHGQFCIDYCSSSGLGSFGTGAFNQQGYTLQKVLQGCILCSCCNVPCRCVNSLDPDFQSRGNIKLNSRKFRN